MALSSCHIPTSPQKRILSLRAHGWVGGAGAELTVQHTQPQMRSGVMGSPFSRVKHFGGSFQLASQGSTTSTVAEFTVEKTKSLETWVGEQRGGSQTVKLFCGCGRASLWLSRDENASGMSGENALRGKGSWWT